MTYLPVEIGSTLRSLRERAPAKMLSQNPFVVEVPENEFKTIRVRALDGVAADTAESASGYATATR